MQNRIALYGLPVLLTLGLATACGADPDERPERLTGDDAPYLEPLGDGGSRTNDGGGSDADDTRCKSGDERECRVYLTSHNGIETCFIGIQVCRRRIWSVCHDPNRPPSDLFPEESN